MPKTDWFRRSTWTPADEAEFRARLKRSRSAHHRAQYLRLQAWHLQDVGTGRLLEAALELLNELVLEYPERTQLAAAHTQRAQCLAALDRPDEAITAYREAFATERSFPSVRSLAYLSFAEFVLALGRHELYQEAFAALDEFGNEELFPIERYRSASAQAFLYAALAEPDLAATKARQALRAAAATESPFHYHRKVGLIEQPDAAVLARLWRLARWNADPQPSEQ